MADAQPKEAVVIDDVWKASAYGEIEKLTELLNVDASCVNKPDAGGYLPLQWAALNNRVAAASLLLERGADVNACDGQGQTALHWAAVRGAVPASELLLRAGARLDKADSRGYTPAHVAAQYGHTAVLYHFAVRWDANMDVLDGDGRAPLHWAAYKGFADACRLLLMLDSDPQRVDREGCNPLHWAAIKGNSEAVHLLTQAGGPSAILATDGQGSTAAQLAQEKGHTMLASYLLSVARHAGSKKKPMQNRGLSIGLAAGIVALVLMFINACVLAPALPAPSAGTTLASYLVVLCVGAGFYFMYRTATRDPGILTGGLETLMLPRPGAGAAARLDIPTLWAGNWGSLCVTCKLVRPLGAKHCSVISKCVARFDHFCPWVGNTIGKRNHRDFAAFLVLQSFALLVSVLTAFTRASHSGMDFAKLVVVCPSLLAFLAIDLVVALPVIMLTSAQVTQLARNITTNELANAHRYPYLRNKDGLFANPFDKGCVQNLRNFVMLSPDQRDLEIEYGETAITPLVDTELHTLLSGGNRASGVTTVSIPPNANARGSANGGAARDV